MSTYGFVIAGGIAGLILLGAYYFLLRCTSGMQSTSTWNKALVIAGIRHIGSFAVALLLAASFTLGIFHFSGHELGTLQSKVYAAGMIIAIAAMTLRSRRKPERG